MEPANSMRGKMQIINYLEDHLLRVVNRITVKGNKMKTTVNSKMEFLCHYPKNQLRSRKAKYIKENQENIYNRIHRN